MDNFDICQKIYDNMEHPDYYDEPKEKTENWSDDEIEEAMEHWK